jgi:hypothetical protein
MRKLRNLILNIQFLQAKLKFEEKPEELVISNLFLTYARLPSDLENLTQ